MSPTFLKLNRDVRRKTQLGLKEEDVIYSPDYMGVRLGYIDEDFDKLSTVAFELPEISPSREYTAILVVNPELYKYGSVQGPTFFPHGWSGSPTILFKPRAKGEIKLSWLVEYRLLA